MAIVKVETELSTDNLLKAVGQLNKHELEQFVLRSLISRHNALFTNCHKPKPNF
jgi:hypothetical protein